MSQIRYASSAATKPAGSRRQFIRQLGLTVAGASLSWPATECLAGGSRKLPRSTPSAQGVDSNNILAFLQALAGTRHEFHSFIFVRHGQVIAEGFWKPYRAESPQMMYSLSKSFTSTAIGLAVAEGRLTVNDPVISFFEEDLPREISDHLKALRVKDLLSMSVGHAQDSTGSLWSEENWVRKFLSLPIANPPGTAFLYNSGATYMLSAIIQKVTGQGLVRYLTPRLFGPMAIENISWERCPRGISTGGWGLKIQTEGLAKFGQLYLQKGMWNGKPLLPASWVVEATSMKIQQPAPDLERARKESDWHQGYGYQFWRCRHSAYRGDGAFGQYTLVMPDQDAVIAITGETPDMQGVLNLIWEHLLPAMKPGVLPASSAVQSKLEQALFALSLRPPTGAQDSALAPEISGKTFQVPCNDACVQSVSLKFHRRTCVFALRDDHGEHQVHCGLGKWVDGATDMPGTPPKLTQGKLPPVSKVAAAGAWKDAQTFEMRWYYYETPHHDTVTCRFAGDTITVEFLDSMTAMAPGRKDKRPVLEGRRRTPEAQRESKRAKAWYPGGCGDQPARPYAVAAENSSAW